MSWPDVIIYHDSIHYYSGPKRVCCTCFDTGIIWYHRPQGVERRLCPRHCIWAVLREHGKEPDDVFFE